MKSLFSKQKYLHVTNDAAELSATKKTKWEHWGNYIFSLHFLIFSFQNLLDPDGPLLLYCKINTLEVFVGWLNTEGAQWRVSAGGGGLGAIRRSWWSDTGWPPPAERSSPEQQPLSPCLPAACSLQHQDRAFHETVHSWTCGWGGVRLYLQPLRRGFLEWCGRQSGSGKIHTFQ